MRNSAMNLLVLFQNKDMSNQQTFIRVPNTAAIVGCFRLSEFANIHNLRTSACKNTILIFLALPDMLYNYYRS